MRARAPALVVTLAAVILTCTLNTAPTARADELPPSPDAGVTALPESVSPDPDEPPIVTPSDFRGCQASGHRSPTAAWPLLTCAAALVEHLRRRTA